MVALVFLYWTAAIFVFGGELNDSIRKARVKRVLDAVAGLQQRKDD
jgi:membrane protein